MLYRFFRAEKKLKGSTIEAKIESKMSLKDEKRGGHAPEAQTQRHPLRLLLFSSFASFFMIGVGKKGKTRAGELSGFATFHVVVLCVKALLCEDSCRRCSMIRVKYQETQKKYT